MFACEAGGRALWGLSTNSPAGYQISPRGGLPLVRAVGADLRRFAPQPPIPGWNGRRPPEALSVKHFAVSVCGVTRRLIWLRHQKAWVLPAVYWSAGCCLRHLGLDCSCFLGCCSQVALFVREPPDDGAVPVVVIEVELLAAQHRQPAAVAGCAVCVGE